MIQLIVNKTLIFNCLYSKKILNAPDKILLIGAVGSDKTGQLLVDTVESEGVKLLAQKIKGENVTTGRCACLLTKGGSQRTMITDLGAALKFCHETWLEEKVNLEWVEKAKFVYISVIFITCECIILCNKGIIE